MADDLGLLQRRLTPKARVLLADYAHDSAERSAGTDWLATFLQSGPPLHAVVWEASHQADLAMHPYVDVLHIRLALARLDGDRCEWERLRAHLARPWTQRPRRWWRPRGPSSAARADAIERLMSAHELAVKREGQRTWPSDVV